MFRLKDKIGYINKHKFLMKKLTIIFIVALIGVLLAGRNTYASSADVDMKKLVNYSRMNSTHKANYLKQRQAQFESWEKYKIPENFRIPVELQSYRGNKSIRYYAIYNPAYHTGVGYVPSNLVQFYEEEAWLAYQQMGSNAPSLSIVLAQQFTESAFNPWATGDNNMSQGLPQLYRKTAEFLYKEDKKTWSQLFYFDRYGKHHFRDIRAMVKFPFMFLPKVKNYTFDQKFESIRRYNGAGEKAIKYAEKIMQRSLFYEELFSQYNSIHLDTTNFKENLFGMINLTLVTRDESPIDPNLLDQIFSNTLSNFSSGYVHNTYMQLVIIPVFESEPKWANQMNKYKIPVDGQDYYLIVEDGRTLYSYFKQADQLLTTINHTKNSPFYLYYNENRKKIKIENLKQVGKHQVFSNVKPGDKLFIPPGTILYSPKSNLAVRIN